MSLPLLITLLVFSCSIILSISSSINLSKAKKRIEELESAAQRKQFEEALLSEIHEALDASLTIEKVVSTFAKRLEILLPFSTISSVVVQDERLLVTINAHEEVSHAYIDEVKDQMLASLAALEKRSFRDAIVIDEITGTVSDTTANLPIASVFHLPLMLHQSVAAIITVTAVQPNRFPDEAIAALQKVMKQTSKTLSKLDAMLQIEKGRLHAMIGNLPDGLLMIDGHNTLQVINPAAKHILSLEKEQITTMDVLSALPIHFDFRSKIIAAIHHNQASEIAHVPLRNKQIRCTITPVLGSTGTVLGASVLMRDETLTNSVPRMKEDFTNIIVHELRNPLTSIKASSELLISPVAFSPDEQRKLIHVIYQQSNKLLSDVQQILDAAKLEAGVFIIHKKSNDLKSLITDVATYFQKEAQEKMINYIVDVDSNLPAFSFDEKYINQALTNLLSNSMKFTSQGGTVNISAKQKQNTVVIAIADTGAGIPKDKQQKLFNKFSQIEEASATVGKGLGLYLVRGIVEAHGGKVEIDSDRGRGTTVFITIPLTDATPITVQPKNPSPDNHSMVN